MRWEAPTDHRARALASSSRVYSFVTDDDDRGPGDFELAAIERQADPWIDCDCIYHPLFCSERTVAMARELLAKRGR